MKRYVVIPRDVEAAQWTGENWPEISMWLNGVPDVDTEDEDAWQNSVVVQDGDSLSVMIGTMAQNLHRDDWIVSEHGRLELVDDATFRSMYRQVGA